VHLNRRFVKGGLSGKRVTQVSRAGTVRGYSAATLVFCSMFSVILSLFIVFLMKNTKGTFISLHKILRITEWWRLESTSGDCLVQLPCSKQGQLDQVVPMSSCALKISKAEGSTTYLGNLLQCLTTLTVKNLQTFLYLNRISCISVCACCLLPCQWVSEESLALSSSPPPSGICTH